MCLERPRSVRVMRGVGCVVGEGREGRVEGETLRRMSGGVVSDGWRRGWEGKGKVYFRA